MSVKVGLSRGFLGRQPQGHARLETAFAAKNTLCLVGSHNGHSLDRRFRLDYDGRAVLSGGVQLTSSGAVTLFSDSSLFVPTGTDFTMLLQLDQQELSSTPVISVGNPGGLGSAECHAYLPFNGDGRAYFRWGGTSGGSSIDGSVPGSATTGVWLMSAGADGLQIWRNGVLIASNSSSPSRSSSTDALRSRPGGGSGTSSTALISIWAAQFPRSVNMALSINPYQIFARALLRAPYVAAASAVPSITAVSSENITSTSADYRVTLDYA